MSPLKNHLTRQRCINVPNNAGCLPTGTLKLLCAVRGLIRWAFGLQTDSHPGYLDVSELRTGQRAGAGSGWRWFQGKQPKAYGFLLWDWSF
jgi:hypothetical protein